MSASGYDMSIETFETYEDYLDSKLSPDDLNYLGDEEVARQLVELGYGLRGLGVEIISRKEFEEKKGLMLEKNNLKSSAPKRLASADIDLRHSPFLQELANREDQVKSGKSTTIIFIRHHNSKGQEVSGYIDFAHRLRTDDFCAIFEGKRLLLPRPSDLSYYNWDTQLSTSNSTPFYQVIADSGKGLQFKNKRDRKLIDVNPQPSIEQRDESTVRIEIRSPEYTQIVLFDHSTRRKNIA